MTKKERDIFKAKGFELVESLRVICKKCSKEMGGLEDKGTSFSKMIEAIGHRISCGEMKKGEAP